MAKTITINLTRDNYQPHQGQLEFHQNQTRFRILSCGRRWGKDYSTIHEAIRHCFHENRSLVWWVAPNYAQAKIGWDMAQHILNPELTSRINCSELFVEFINGSQLWFKTADNPDALRGQGINFLVIDEAATIKREAWENALRPALSDTMGKAVFIGTPKGHNWFFELWTRGNDPHFIDYKSWSYPTSNNPHINKSEIEEARKTLPHAVFQQEYEAEFLDDVGQVFRHIRDCVGGELEEPNGNKHYMVGVDLAKHEDFTVICVLDEKGQLSHFDRFSQLDWVFQSKRIVDVCKRYNNARLLLDSTGVGDPVYDMLRRSGVSVEGYKFTNASKKDLIENLSIQIENQSISYPDIPVLISELGLFGYKISPAGVTSYNAPEGYHDDCVIALALACWQIRSSGVLETERLDVSW